MKKKFPGYFRLTENDFTLLWKDCTFVFDTNTLLDLYRVSEQTYNEISTCLKSIHNRIWIPYHVGAEFFKNRFGVILDQQIKFKAVKDSLDCAINDINSKLNSFRDHKLINKKEISKKISSLFNTIKKDLDSKENEYPDYYNKDDILDNIVEIIGDKVGTKYSEEKQKQFFSEADIRYKKEIPPGYKDQKNKHGDEKYGDFLIWKELLDYACTNKKNIIFITRDTKEDWFLKVDKQTIGPRPELINEFCIQTKQKLYIYSFENFLELSKKYTKTTVSASTTQEISEIERENALAVPKFRSDQATSSGSPYLEELFRQYTNYLPAPGIIPSIYNQQYIKNYIESIKPAVDFITTNNKDQILHSKLNEAYTNYTREQVEEMRKRYELLLDQNKRSKK